MIPRILLTMGEPAGIGPDLCALIAHKSFPCELIVVGDPVLLGDRARLLGIDLQLTAFEPGRAPSPHRPGVLRYLPVGCAAGCKPGHLNPAWSGYVLETIETAVRGCLSGDFDALVTAPVHKGVINEAGIAFSGHTEYIAAMTGGHPVMMLAIPGLRVALATTHLPLSEVSAAITGELIESVLRILSAELDHRFGVQRPRILVCGLNPHAGEGGHLGREELEIIEPVLEVLRAEGMQLHGPLPADTLFLPKYLEHADAVLAMYHDQGLPVLKYAGFGRAVNITLGLPIIRTSVDHGTALDLAGTGRVDTGSLEAAIAMAVDMAARSRERQGKIHDA